MVLFHLPYEFAKDSHFCNISHKLKKYQGDIRGKGKEISNDKLRRMQKTKLKRHKPKTEN